jgi:peptidoglycan/LPS O-acetylase OafA/YrhL
LWPLELGVPIDPTQAGVIFRSRRAARYRNMFSRLLTIPSALVLGDASYMIYLVYYVVLMITTKLIGSAVHGAIFNAIAFILSTIATLVVSILLYACYKSPVRKWLRRLWRHERPPVVTAKI